MDICKEVPRYVIFEYKNDSKLLDKLIDFDENIDNAFAFVQKICLLEASILISGQSNLSHSILISPHYKGFVPVKYFLKTLSSNKSALVMHVCLQNLCPNVSVLSKPRASL